MLIVRTDLMVVVQEQVPDTTVSFACRTLQTNHWPFSKQ